MIIDVRKPDAPEYKDMNPETYYPNNVNQYHCQEIQFSRDELFIILKSGITTKCKIEDVFRIFEEE